MASLNLLAQLTASAALAAAAAVAAPALPDAVAAALADPARPPEEMARDVDRKAGEVLAFAGVKQGDRVADFMSGGGYFTRLLSDIVGDKGRVYAFVPDEQLKNCAPEETAGTRALRGDAHYANVSVLIAPVARFRTPEALDLVWTSLNFHDLYDTFMGPADVREVARALFNALKPGGVLMVIDHAAQAGSHIRDTETLHRIDPEVIVQTLEGAGFVLEAQSDLLRNPRDNHQLRVFDPAIRGRTDQVILKFRKPDSRARPAL
jgi:predicted methyltransferase